MKRIALIVALLLTACSSTEEPDPGPPPTRLEAIPEDAVKMTPETDHFPPRLVAGDFDLPVPLEGPVNTAGVEDAPKAAGVRRLEEKLEAESVPDARNKRPGRAEDAFGRKPLGRKRFSRAPGDGLNRTPGGVRVLRCHVSEAYNVSFVGRAWAYASFALSGLWAGLTAWSWRSPRRWQPILAAGLLLGLSGLPTVREMLRAGRATASDLTLGISLREVAPRGATVLVDPALYARGALQMHREMLLMRFWNPDKRVLTRRRQAGSQRLDYFVSGAGWPYPEAARKVPHESAGPPRWVLYRVEGSAKPILDDPSFIDLARWPAERLEGFYPVEGGDYRWTAGRSSVLLPPLPRGSDLELTMALGGGRPSRNPARVEVLLDGHPLGIVEKGRGGSYPTFRVPADLVTGGGQRLELNVNTFRPADLPGWPQDHRDLGVRLDWISIQPAGRLPGDYRP